MARDFIYAKPKTRLFMLDFQGSIGPPNEKIPSQEWLFFWVALIKSYFLENLKKEKLNRESTCL